MEKVREHWNLTSSKYQKKHKISTDYVHFGTSCPTEDDLNLLGNVKDKKIIELGFGGAQCSIALSKRGAICTVIDLSEEQLKFTKKLAKKVNVDIKLIQGDIQNLDMISDDSFDIAFSAVAFCWVQNLQAVFQETRRVLKNRGIFVFSTEHPIWARLGDKPEDLTIKSSYFKRTELYKESSGITIEFYIPTFSDIIIGLIETGFEMV
ncbi:MAG: class I SAM-dependent methyltransferase [Candidatus Thorarchaeota archaeon]